MKIIFQRDTLARSLDMVQCAAQNKVTSNTNNGFYIHGSGSTVEFQANDFTIAVRTTCQAVVEEEGETVVAAPQLPYMIRLLPQGEVVMEQHPGEGLVKFTSGNAVYHFPIRSVDDFPPVETLSEVGRCTVAAPVLAEMVNLTQYAAATDKQKPFFTGILFEIKGLSFAMAATNTHRLAAKEVTLTEEAAQPGRFIVPASVMSDVVRLLPQEKEEQVAVSWARSHVAFSFGSTYFVANLINGEYPDYHRVIPARFDSTVVLDLKAFQQGVSMVSPISRDMDYKTIHFNFEEGRLDIYEEDRSIGSSRASIPAELTGEPINIIFNCMYIEDILKHSRGETVILHLLRNGPMLVEQEEDKTYQYVVTPMRGRG